MVNFRGHSVIMPAKGPPVGQDLKNEGSLLSSSYLRNGMRLIMSPGLLVRGDIEKPKRTIGTFAILAASFNILNTWFGLASTLVLGFANGGPVTILYGLILISVVYIATAFSLAELSARYPTAGGQYHWTSILAPPKLSRALVCFSILLQS